MSSDTATTAVIDFLIALARLGIESQGVEIVMPDAAFDSIAADSKADARPTYSVKSQAGGVVQLVLAIRVRAPDGPILLRRLTTIEMPEERMGYPWRYPVMPRLPFMTSPNDMIPPSRTAVQIVEVVPS